jgi:polyferredoxin
MLSFTTAAGVGLGIAFQQRTWCYICPIGTMSNWVGKNRRPLTLAPEKCLECHLCARACPMQLAPVALKDHEYMPNQGDCLKCSLCVSNCPTAALTFQERSSHKQAA